MGCQGHGTCGSNISTVADSSFNIIVHITEGYSPIQPDGGLATAFAASHGYIKLVNGLGRLHGKGVYFTIFKIFATTNKTYYIIGQIADGYRAPQVG